ncbi:MAG: hypothetical protein AAF637_24025, partial [Pseudomonadota bacterium]
DKGLVRFFLVWLAFAVLPFVLIAPRIEIRYVAPALLPLAGLTYLGLDLCLGLLRQRFAVFTLRPGPALMALVVLVAGVGFASRMVQGLTAHEVEMTSFHRLIGRLDETYGRNAYALATPNEYSTFLYLRLMYPDRHIYNAFDPFTAPEVRAISKERWASAQGRFYDGHLLRNIDQVRAMDRPLLYAGFPEAMPVANLRRMADRAPASLGAPLIQRLDKLDTRDQLALSWMWAAPELDLELVEREGNYVVYRVDLAGEIAQGLTASPPG